MFRFSPGNSGKRFGAPVASLTHEAHMATETQPTSRTENYKGCAIQAASYKVGPQEWAAEACFCQRTQSGWIVLWIKSFEHLFGPQGRTFPTEKEADEHAFCVARQLIDKTRDDLQRPSRPTAVSRWRPSSLWKRIR
jgi:hypothetical protein